MGQPSTSPLAITVAMSSLGHSLRSAVMAPKYSLNPSMVPTTVSNGSDMSPMYSGSAAPNMPWVSSSIFGSSSRGTP